MTSTAALVKSLQEGAQDHEFYPTTGPMIDAINAHLENLRENRFRYHHRQIWEDGILDPCAGDGRLLFGVWPDRERSKPSRKAVELSDILLQELHKRGATVVGTDFWATNLLSKRCSVAVVNPPYSDFEDWVAKLLTELKATVFYLVIPSRWRDSAKLARIVDEHHYTFVETVFTGDFHDADRRARAKVEIVAISREIEADDEGAVHWRRRDSLFDSFAAGLLGLSDKSEKLASFEIERSAERRAKSRLEAADLPSTRVGLVSALVEAYEGQLGELIENYKAVGALNPRILRTLNVDVAAVREALRGEIEGLKRIYWRLLMSHAPEFLSYLSSAAKRRLQESLSEIDLDFTESNIRWTLALVAQQAVNGRSDTLTVVYNDFFSERNASRFYQSNKRIDKDDLRWNRGNRNAIRYVLDYRLVHCIGFDGACFTTHYGSRPMELSDRAREFVSDLVAVANLLGWECSSWADALYGVRPGEKAIVYSDTGQGRVSKAVEIPLRRAPGM